MSQRKTQTAAYWQDQFAINKPDIEFIINQILESNRLFDLDEIAVALVKNRCEAEERETRSELQRGKLYQPKESFVVDEKVVFPRLNFALGTVTYTREGHHPEYGTFTVIGVTFENNGNDTHEFVAEFDHPHTLNNDDQSMANIQGLMPPEELYTTYEEAIRPKIKAALEANPDFVEFHEQYYLRDLLSDFHEGLFNIADAAIDINAGPLHVDALIEQMGLVEDQGPMDVLRFSVNHYLDQDERFIDAGPSGQVLWYLDRLAPPETHHPPRRLQASGDQSYSTDSFDDDLLTLLTEIDDEFTDPDDISLVGPEIDRITIVLNYPHWRVGTLPITPKTESFFQISYYNPVLFEFIDGRTGNTFPGWVIYNGKYVFGLEEWYRQNKLPVGAYIDLKRTDDPMRLIVDYQATRTQRDWVKVGAVVDNQLTFQMNTAPLSCKYDDLMMIGDTNSAEIDRLWLSTEEKEVSIFNLLCHLIPELSKLNPQSTVHAKTLYSALNIIRRTAPGVIFEELTKHRCFIPMRHGYWTYDPSLRDD